jgi:hypothetical protein
LEAAVVKRASKSKRGTPKPIGFDMPELPKELIERLLGALTEGGPMSSGEGSPADELEAAFQDFLDLDEPKERDKAADEVISHLSDQLDQFRVDANGGDPRARESLKRFHARLDLAVADEEIHPANLILLGKIMWTAQLPVSDALREFVGEAMGGDAALAPENTEHIAKLALRAVERIDDPFELYDAVSSNMAAFPTKFRIALATSLVVARKSVVRMAAVGFVVHPEEELARAVIKTFPFSAPPSAAEDAVVARLTRVAAWLAPGRLELAEAAFGAMRSSSRATPAAAERDVQFLASSHDGSGSNSMMACVKSGKRFAILSVLIKSQGVIEVLEYGDLDRGHADRLMGLMGSSSPVLNISADGAAELLALALGRNISARSPPPFRFVQFCEAVGWADLRPDPSSASQICKRLLEGSRIAKPAVRTSTDVCYSPYVESWFEAGEAVGELLRGMKSRKLAADKLLREYLPSRRQFWARLCATSALVFRRRAGAPNAAWKEFALVGRDIASETPIEQIPLMVQIAARTAGVFFDRP